MASQDRGTGPYVPPSAWAEWIPQLFEPRQFLTLTAREPVFIDTMRRRHGYLVQQVNRELYGNHWRRKGGGISSVFSVEPQLRGVPHIHAVWDADRVPYQLIHSIWNRISGWAWLEPVSSNCGVAHYVTKYAVKSGHVYVYLARQIEALRQRSPEVTLGGACRIGLAD